MTGCGSLAGDGAILQEVWQSFRGCGSHAGGVAVMQGVWQS